MTAAALDMIIAMPTAPSTRAPISSSKRAREGRDRQPHADQREPGRVEPAAPVDIAEPSQTHRQRHDGERIQQDHPDDVRGGGIKGVAEHRQRDRHGRHVRHHDDDAEADRAERQRAVGDTRPHGVPLQRQGGGCRGGTSHRRCRRIGGACAHSRGGRHLIDTPRRDAVPLQRAGKPRGGTRRTPQRGLLVQAVAHSSAGRTLGT